MPRCKFCGAQISKLDKDICPMCGERKPLEGSLDETVDFTHVMDVVEGEAKEVHLRSRRTCGILAIILGVVGVHNFYAYKYKLAVINIVEALVVIGGIGSLLFFLTPLKIWGYLITYFLILCYDIWVGITYLTKHDVMDGRGELMR